MDFWFDFPATSLILGEAQRLLNHRLARVTAMLTSKLRGAVLNALVGLTCAVAIGCGCVRESSAGEIHIGAAILAALSIASLCLRRWRTAAFCVAVTVGCFMLKEMTGGTWDGIVGVDSRLTIRGQHVRGLSISVASVPGRVGDDNEVRWEEVAQGDEGHVVFAGQIEVMVYEPVGFLRPPPAWTYFGQIPMLIRVGDQEFAFLPDDLYTASHSGHRPNKLVGSIDIDDYLSGKVKSRPFGELDLRRVE
jgi:hypothetical protein